MQCVKSYQEIFDDFDFSTSIPSSNNFYTRFNFVLRAPIHLIHKIYRPLLDNSLLLHSLSLITLL